MWNMKKLFTSSLGDDVCLYKEALIICFTGKRNVVSSCNLNGGYRSDLRFVFNHSCGRRIKAGEWITMNGNNMYDHYESLAKELDLPAEQSTGLTTAALIDNMSVVTHAYEDKLSVTAITTAGIDINGGRAGDKAQLNEFNPEVCFPSPGTINIILLINAFLDAGTLMRASVTATEAKVAALQELMANSLYSEGLATGSGTDGIVVIGNLEADTQLYDAGKHYILGELIGRAVKESVKEALGLQSGMNATRQSSIEWQNKRYSITRQNVYDICVSKLGTLVSFEDLQPSFDKIFSDNLICSYVASIIHLVDQYKWGLISEPSLLKVGMNSLNSLRKEFDLEELIIYSDPVCPYSFLIDLIKETMAILIATN